MAKRYLYVAEGSRETRMPIDAVTRTFAFLGQRGTGKTNAAVVLAEEMALAGGNVALFDPVGAHWGITRRGEREGIPGIVIGGEHGDVPLEETGGQLVAELIVARHWPIVVVDMKLMRKGAQLRFMADCLEALFQMNREPLHVIFEEADRIMPQQLRSGDIFASRALGAGEDIVKLGRSRGLGASIVTQRPATIAKNVLEQVENLFLFRLIGPRDRKAARDWIEANADPKREKEVLDSLAKLKLGEAWLWSPAWLGLLRRIQVRHRRTFDSSFTPEVGAVMAEAGERAPVSLDEVRDQMAETIERAKENDPKALKAEIVKLRGELETARKAHAGTIEPKPKLVPYVPEELRALAVKAAAEGQLAVDGAARLLGEIEELPGLVERGLRSSEKLLGRIEEVARGEGAEEASATHPAAGYETSRGEGVAAPALPRSSRPGGEHVYAANSKGEKVADIVGSGANGTLGKAPRALLTVLAQFPAGRTKQQLGILSGYSPKSSSYDRAIADLRKKGLASPAGTDPIRATESGLALLPDVPPAPTGHELVGYWRGRLGKAPLALFDALVDAYPRGMAKEELGERSGYSSASSSYDRAIAKLRSLELAIGYGEIRAVDALFG